jgi:hypothetical protein
MKKLLTLLCTVLLLSTTAFAKEVAVPTAQQVAINWMVERSGWTPGQVMVKETFAVSEGSKVVYYVFNMNPSGFAILSADDIAYPVIAYSFEGAYSDSARPPAFDMMMNSAKEEIVYAVQNRLEPLDKAKHEWGRLTVVSNRFTPNRLSGVESVSPLLQTVWDQSGGSILRPTYNKFCPSDLLAPEGHAPTGCVATAMAQVMKKHNYPTRGVGTHSYTSSNYGNQSADFGATTYNWSNMPNELSAWPSPIGSTETQINAVATLMYHAGVSVDMNYAASESGAPPTKTRNSFVQYFDYSVEATLIMRDYYNNVDQWLQLMRYELESSRPVFYGGSGSGAHVFVMDGYQGDAYFNFNWGWGGSHNGYFYLDALTPGGHNYSTGQYAIIRIIPSHTGPSNNIPVLWANQISWQAPKAGGASDPIYVWNSNPTSTVNINYSVSSDASWLTTSTTSGSSGTYVFSESGNTWSVGVNNASDFTISASQNTSGSSRTGHITLTATSSGVYASPKVITVTQPSSATTNPVDVALVIDRSGSMSSSGYLTPAKNAASTFVGFMQNDDNVGVVSFDQSSYVNFPLTLITSSATKTAAQNAINSITAGGSTSIGIGMQTGQTQLNRGRTGSHQAMILLSDGYSNTAPWVRQVLPTIPNNTDIYTIALGSASDADTLSLIASQTGGAYSFAPDATRLQEIYNNLRGTITNQQTIASISDVITQGTTKSHTAPVDGLTSRVTFSVAYQSGNLDLTLVSPRGRTITPTSADSTITYSKGSTYVIYGIKAPESGSWTLRVIGTSAPSSVAYTALAQGTSDLTINAFANQTQTETGQPIAISAILVSGRIPVTGASMNVKVQAPGSSTYEYRMTHANEIGSDEALPASIGRPEFIYATDSLLLYDDGLHDDGAADDGLYSNSYNKTSHDGSYTFNIIAEGSTSSGGAFRREGAFSTVVRISTRPPVPVLLSLPNSTKNAPLNPILKWGSLDTTSFRELEVSYFVSSSLSQTRLTFVDTLVRVDSLRVQGLSYNRTYFWRVRAVSSTRGRSDWSQEWSFSTGFDPASERICYPNPFNPLTDLAKFRFKVEKSGNVSIRIYDIANTLVKEIIGNRQYDAGIWEIPWDGKNDRGDIVANGVYFYVVESGSGERAVNKIAVLK